MNVVYVLFFLCIKLSLYFNNLKYAFFQVELENLNTATDDINKLEIELEVRNEFCGVPHGVFSFNYLL